MAATSSTAATAEDPLSLDEIQRYGRQMLIRDIGRPGQERLKRASVLVVGVGGLGSPAALYLAAAGIGTLGLVDHDAVEVSNLQRQVLHEPSRAGHPKAESGAASVHRLNPHVRCHAHVLLLTAATARPLVAPYDIILDCTDNVATRYLLNDVCVLLGKPLVSGAALRWEGQLTVYHHANGPCYRCLFPTPPPPDTVARCGDVGVLGPVTGTIGVLQALEAVKLALGLPPNYAQKLLLFDAWDGSFRTIQLRARNRACAVCGDAPTVTDLIDYVQFCGSGPDDGPDHVELLPLEQRLTPAALAARQASATILDVRPSTEFGIAHLPGAINVPWTDLPTQWAAVAAQVVPSAPPLVVVCRRGNNSQYAVQWLRTHAGIDAVDVVGGLRAWSADVDPAFPLY